VEQSASRSAQKTDAAKLLITGTVTDLGLAGTHYTGMAAVTMEPQAVDVGGTILSNQTLAFHTFVSVVIMMVSLTVASLFKSVSEPV